MYKEHMDDSLFEVFIGNAMVRKEQRDNENLPSEEKCAKLCQYSDFHNFRMKRLFAKDRRREIFSKIKKTIRYTAAAILVLVTLLFSALYTFSPEVRAAVNETVLKWYSIFVRSEPDFNAPSESVNLGDWELGYIPNEFVLIEEIDDDLGCLYIFEGNDQMIMVSIYEKTTDMLIDNENGAFQTIITEVNEYSVFDSSDNGEDNTIFWETEDAKFLISSVLPVDELLKIADAIKK
ncbi:MAG: DUF4367 domain-containing protein [Oscillospiraceae bacterium]|nr:DUF4367 domain-containing protein [Oscillospiraceae bacterium]